MLEDVVSITIKNRYTIPKPQASFIELWNPKVSEVESLFDWLEANRKVCYIWCYGFDDGPEYNFSNISHSRVVGPMWLGKTQEEAYEVYTKAFKHLVAATITEETKVIFEDE